MKIKFLALVALFGAMSSNVLAADNDWALDKDNGVRYTFDNSEAGKDGTTLALAYSAHVYGPATAVTSMTVPASFTTTDENGIVKYFKVVGFADGWGNTAVTTPAKEARAKVTPTLTTLSIDATNFAALTDLSKAFTNLKALTTLTVSDTNGSVIMTIANLGLTADVKKSLTTLDISGMKGITTIEASAFAVATNVFDKLTSIKVPAGLTTIKANAFEGSKVTSIAFPATLISIENVAFKNSALTSVDLSGTKVTSIEAWTFEATSALATVTLNANTTAIGLGAFHSSAITAINIPEKVTSIANQAFQKCEALASVTGMTKVTSIGDNAFDDAKVLATCDLSAAAELTTIGASAFKGTALTAVTIPNKVTTIGSSAFEGCAALATVSIAAPAGAPALTNLGTNLFKGDAALTSADLTNMNAYTIDATTFSGCAKLAEVKIAKSITYLPVGVFEGTVLTSLDLSETGITSLDNIFKGTKDKPYASLTSINLPKNLDRIYDVATFVGGKISTGGVFSYCTGLTEVTLPGSLTYDVPDYTFYYCTALKTLTYQPSLMDGETVVEIEEKAFIGCTPFVLLITNADFRSTWPDVPFNATFGDDADLKVKTVADKGTSGMFFGKFCPQVNASISKEDLGDAKLYSVYIDEDIAYFQNLRIVGGHYQVAAGQHVIVKSKEATTIEFEPWGGSSVVEDQIETANNFTDVAVSDFQANDMSIWCAAPYWEPAPKYLYLLTNKADNGGFGFTFFKGTTMKKGNFFISTNAAPNAGGRLETVWLDEDGNVETGIKEINAGKAQDGAIYNLQGVRVKAAQKGFYIQNGKKYIK